MRGPLSGGAGLIADCLQLGHTLLAHRIGHLRASIFDRVVEVLELGLRLRPSLAEFGNMPFGARHALSGDEGRQTGWSRVAVCVPSILMTGTRVSGGNVGYRR
jgi:hypothetical protein